MMIDKPIIIVGHGPSCEQLNANIMAFHGIKDVLWSSLNRFYIPEDEILSKIDRVFDIIWCSSPVRLEQSIVKKRIIEASGRGSIIFTTSDNVSRMEKMGCNQAGTTIYSDFGYGYSSLFSFLCALIKQGARQIILFGFDGCAQDEESVYWGQDKIEDDFRTRKLSILRDTVMMNLTFWDYVEYSLNVNRSDVDIINCCPSAITCFRGASINQIIERLR